MATVKPTTTPFTLADAQRFHQGDVSDSPEFAGYWSLYGDPPDEESWWMQNNQLTPQALNWFGRARQGGNQEAAQQAAQDNDSLFGDFQPIASIMAMIPGPWQPFAAAASALNSASQGNWLSAIGQGYGAYSGFSSPGFTNSFSGGTPAAGGSMPQWLTDIGNAISGIFGGDSYGSSGDFGSWGVGDVDPSNYGYGNEAGAFTGLTQSGGGSGIMDTIGKILTGSGGGGGDIGKWLPAILGGLFGATQNKVDPTTTSSAPWNADQWAAPQAKALELMNSQLTLPEVPEMPVMDDRFLQTAISAAIDPTVRDFQNRIMPGIRGDFNDQYGSTKHQLATGRAVEGLTRNTQNTGALLSQAFYPQMFQSQRDAIRWPYEQKAAQATAQFNAPFTALTNTANVLSQAGRGGTTQTTQNPQTPWWQSGIGGAISAQNLWNIINGRA